MKSYRIVLAGLGNVGRHVLQIMQSQQRLLQERYQITLQLVGVVDSSGAALNLQGLDPAAILAAKQQRLGVASLPEVGRPGMSASSLLQVSEADMLLEATPVNLTDGQPGLETVRFALLRGISVVLANKGPLVLAYQELAELSDMGPDTEERGDRRDWPALRFSACVGGALPSINIGLRDLAGARIERVEAVLNGTTQGILRMMEAGSSYDEALVEMQRRGLAETDPSLDVEGWDAANKLVILANAVLQQPTTLQDLTVEGITTLTSADLLAATARGERIVLLGLAERLGTTYRLSVRPTALPSEHPLARMSGEEMGIVYTTDITGQQFASSREADPLPTASAMLRDLIEIANR